jgi:hypothetical protein
MLALMWILNQPRTTEGKLAAFEKLMGLPKALVVIPSMKKFLGW